MKISLTILILTTIGFYSCGQNTPSDSTKTDIETEVSLTIDESRIKIDPFSSDSYVHTEADYIDSNGKGIIIQNSYPRGGGYIPTPSILRYGHAVFWTRIINKSDKPLELDIDLSADAFNIFPSADAHVKLLIPPNEMTLDKVTTFSFGFENIDSFLSTNFYKRSIVKKTILPNEDYIFYVVLLSHLAPRDQGVSRTGLFLDGENFVYRLTIDSSNSTLIPCGQIRYN